MGRADAAPSNNTKGDNDNKLLPRQGTKKTKKKKKKGTKEKETTGDSLELPSISDLFPPDVTKKETRNSKSASSSSSSGQSLDGVLPVSELFYRSSQAITGEEKDTSSSVLPGGDDGDDEELPFSAEQTDELTTDGNKVKIRRNRAAEQPPPAPPSTEGIPRKSKNIPRKRTRANNKRNRGRKLVRRGMEMFLGGQSINADPPQRSIELTYKAPEADDQYSWASTITLNTGDFGPLLQTGAAQSVNPVELGLFCENFVSAAMKWDVCPKNLREIVRNHVLQQDSPLDKTVLEEVDCEASTSTSSINVGISNSQVSEDNDVRDDEKTEDEDNILSLLRNIDETDSELDVTPDSSKDKKKSKQRTAAKGFAKKSKKKRNRQYNNAEQKWRMVGFFLKFSIGVTKEELESGDSRDAAGSVMRGVLTRGITTFLKSELNGLMVKINTLKLQEGDDGATTVIVEFSLDGIGDASQEDIEKIAAAIDAALSQAVDDGDFALALAAAAKEETSWPEAVRDRVVEEFLLEDDDVHVPWEEPQTDQVNGPRSVRSSDAEPKSKPKPTQDRNGEPGTLADRSYAEDDIFGQQGVFFDYSESNAANAPFKGQLGPALLDAVTATAVERPPRVIAIGDVHGCIDELQDLLRLCDYRPGDQIVFLGDLVSKGPDSISVVQMAREIGAIAVRGNHDFEVIRWHQAIKAGKNIIVTVLTLGLYFRGTNTSHVHSLCRFSGVDPPVVGSEHFHIASCLSLADMRWMYCQPWFMASKELGALFVHAGLVSGIRLSKQNPRLMMNMRSILPDGTVTSKFFNNWPWARLWDGPQTVLFGHDADRGLQQYEHAIGLDTGCVYGGRLTACILPEKRLVSVSARQEYFKYRRKHYD